MGSNFAKRPVRYVLALDVRAEPRIEKGQFAYFGYWDGEDETDADYAGLVRDFTALKESGFSHEYAKKFIWRDKHISRESHGFRDADSAYTDIGILALDMPAYLFEWLP
jgi:hypothetical protein